MKMRLHFPSLPSTNAYALKQFSFLFDGAIVTADTQTEGYGRFKRAWRSTVKGNLYCSLLVKPEEAIAPAIYGALPLYTALTLAQTFASFGARVDIRWPNDLIVNGKKIAGILVEGVTEERAIVGAVVGVGANLFLTEDNLRAIDQPATALNLETGDIVPPQSFLDAFARLFFEREPRFLSEGFAFLREEYSARASFIGTRVRVATANGIVEGIATTIDADGRLYIENETGTHRLSAGELTPFQ